jgi:hypothetical protein
MTSIQSPTPCSPVGEKAPPPFSAQAQTPLRSFPRLQRNRDRASFPPPPAPPPPRASGRLAPRGNFKSVGLQADPPLGHSFELYELERTRGAGCFSVIYRKKR